jgi:Asp-tRNA(Asn)/Glu-tRNA(Gln) amidotransferase B subunit
MSILTTFNELVKQHPGKWQQVMADQSLAGWFVGQIMKALEGKPSLEDVQFIVMMCADNMRMRNELARLKGENGYAQTH